MTIPPRSLLQQTRDRLVQAIAQQRQVTSLPNSPSNEALRAALEPERQQLTDLLDKLEQKRYCCVVFGLVSRGKSALINALIGEPRLETGPINGITREPERVTWTPPGSPLTIDLIDTPGLDEIDGQARAALATDMAQQADLILFVVAGDISRTEYQAIRNLWKFHKPLLLVFNKSDLYPTPDRQAIRTSLQRYLSSSSSSDPLSPPLPLSQFPLDAILLASADPAPIPVRIEGPDGRFREALESLPPDIANLQAKILEILHQQGSLLLSLNTLVQVRQAEQSIAAKTLLTREAEAEALIWQYSRWKAGAIALNPIAVADVLGGLASDLALIRALARLYQLPMTSHEAGRLLGKIWLSSGSLLLGELGGSLLFGLGKSAAVAGMADGAIGWEGYAGAAAMQAGLAAYGSYIVGKAAQQYLEQGCTWGETGASTLIANLLEQVPRDGILARLRSFA